jgi:hypothetical protein
MPIKLEDIYAVGIDPLTHELKMYPKGKKPVELRLDTCQKCRMEGREGIKGKKEVTPIGGTIFTNYECPYGHRWEGVRRYKKRC